MRLQQTETNEHIISHRLLSYVKTLTLLSQLYHIITTIYGYQTIQFRKTAEAATKNGGTLNMADRPRNK